MTEPVGQFLGNYQLLSLLGRGAFAEVYLAEHRYLGIHAAIKILYARMERSTHAQFQREARTIAHLQHAHIVRVLDFGFQDQTPFLVMAYTPNGTLRTKHPKGTRLSLEQIVHYVKQIAPALDYAHQQGVIHRDVKPENMLLSANDEVMLSDFGLAIVQRSMNSLSTQSKNSLLRQNQAGTPIYMAPEQIQGKPCAASDQYALGILVYEWLCGEPPFRGSLFEVFSQHLYQPPPGLCERLPSFLAAVEEVVFKALAKEPQARFVNVQDFAAVLEEVVKAAPSFTLMVSSTRLPREQDPLTVSTQGPSLEEHERSSSDPQSLSLWNVPYPHNPFFTGREELLDRLVTMLQPGQAAALSQPVAISGLGGIGKTQVAVEYAYRHRQDYQQVFWVRADRRENLASDFVAIARELHLPVVDTQQSLHAMQAWLRTHGNWLLILDNADDLTLAREFLPPAYGGQVLLTTRAHATGRLAQRIEVDTMPEEVGVLFLLRRAGLIAPGTSLELVKPQERELARELAHELGGLPLALDQAGAYMEETPCGIEEYLRLFRTRRSVLLSRRGGIVDDHPTSVATTWSLAFASVEQANPAAADLLYVCAFLHPDAIPEDLLRQGATQTEAPLQVPGTSDLAFHEALRTLGAYSLLRRDLSSRTLSIHRLVQAVLIDAMTPEIMQAWVERTTHLLLTALPDSFATGWAVWEHLLPHVLTCAEHILQAQLISSEATHFLGLAGNYLREHSHYTEAESLYWRALQIHEQKLGPTHLVTVAFLNDIGRVYRDKGEYAEAERLLKRTLVIREQGLGPMHPATAISLEDLGQIFQAQSKYAEAEAIYQRTLAIREQELGPMHPTTAGIFCNLGNLYQAQGKYAEAEALYLRAQAIYKQELGPMHPTTAGIFCNLGNLYKAQGKYAEAEALYLRAKVIYEQERGPMHPATAWLLINLGVLYQAQGRLTEAEEALQRSLAIGEKLQDTRHMAMVLYHLGNVYQAQGKLTEAKEVLQQALLVCEQQVRPNVEQPYAQMIREDYEALLKQLAGLAEGSGDTPGEVHQKK